MRAAKIAAVAAALLVLTACQNVVKSVGPVKQDETAEVTCWEEGKPGTEYTVTWNVLGAVAPEVGQPWQC